MNIRDLTYIIAVDKYRAFGRAALECNVSQPTLSGQVKKLEAELGVTLFERSNKAVRTTHIGRDIIDIAKEITGQVETLKMVAQSAHDPYAGKLSLGFIPTIAPYIVPLFVSKMSVAFPNLFAAYQENLTEVLNANLLNGELDVALLATPPQSDKLEAIKLYREPFWLVYPQGHDLDRVKTLRITDIPTDEVLLLSEGHCFRDQALSICQPRNIVRQQSIRATSLETLVNMVSARQGLTLMPALSLQERAIESFGIKARKIEGEGAERTVYLTYRKLCARKKLIRAIAALITRELPDTVTLL